MYEAARPPSGPSTHSPTAASSAWYFQVLGAGNQCQRRAEGVASEEAGIELTAADATRSGRRGEPFSDHRQPLLARGRRKMAFDLGQIFGVQLDRGGRRIFLQMHNAAGLRDHDDLRLG